MSDDLTRVDDLAAALLQRIAPAGRRKILRKIARDGRKEQSDRIARQIQPDGQGFAPRKASSASARKGQLRSRMMFRKLRMARFLKAGSTDTEAWIGYAGRAAAIARVHQEGLEDSPTRGARKVRYVRRVLLGLSDRQEQQALDTILAELSA
jgi:phage virion morphogenesis protein